MCCINQIVNVSYNSEFLNNTKSEQKNINNKLFRRCFLYEYNKNEVCKHSCACKTHLYCIEDKTQLIDNLKSEKNATFLVSC